MEIIQNTEILNSSLLPEPTVSGTFGHAWEIMKKRFPELLLVMLIQMVLSAPTGAKHLLFAWSDANVYTIGMFQFIYSLLVVMPVSYGCSWVYLKAIRGDSFRFQDVFFAYQSFGNILVANLLVFLIVVAGFIMLIVPGIIFACKLAFVPYLVMDEKMEAVDAVRKSWNMTRGFSWTIFLMGFLSIFVAIGGLICFIVGIFPAAIWISLAFACIYWVISAKTKVSAESTSETM